MADSIALPRLRSTSPQLHVVKLLPGMALLAAIGYAGKLLEQNLSRYGKAHHLVIPNIEYVLWAILIGLAIANTVTIPAAFLPGIATYEFWLKSGIVLLGARFVIGDVIKLGSISLVLV
ncbi:MAG TPA: putative sulfate exporter family transporter, partial [archaeon]|nr:putative sulfate exporter family transporter [archaeon]